MSETRATSSTRVTSSPRGVGAALVLDVRVELVPVLLQVRDDGEAGAVGERADRLAHHLIADAQEQIHFVDLGVALLDAAADLGDPRHAFAARRALPAAF